MPLGCCSLLVASHLAAFVITGAAIKTASLLAFLSNQEFYRFLYYVLKTVIGWF
jgi:hypothetical protein